MEERGAEPEQRRFTWEEIAQRTGRGPAADERWLVIDRKVYDISRFHRRHPGGSRVISHYAGQDATVRGRGAGQGRGVSAARMGSGHGAVRRFPLLPLSCALRKEMPLFSARKEEKKKGGRQKPKQTKEGESSAVLGAAVALRALARRGGRPSVRAARPAAVCAPLLVAIGRSAWGHPRPARSRLPPLRAACDRTRAGRPPPAAPRPLRTLSSPPLSCGTADPVAAPRCSEPTAASCFEPR